MSNTQGAKAPAAPRGFLSSTIDAIMSAPASLPGVRLGRVMLRDNYSVIEIAQELGLSKVALYPLIRGERLPKPPTEDRILALLKRIE